jgi:hypothetical protein
MITRETIQKRHDSGVGCRINDLIRPWKWEIIFGRGLIQVCEIYTHPLFSIFLFDWHGVSQPLWVHDPVDETGI